VVFVLRPFANFAIIQYDQKNKGVSRFVAYAAWWCDDAHKVKWSFKCSTT